MPRNETKRYDMAWKLTTAQHAAQAERDLGKKQWRKRLVGLQTELRHEMTSLAAQDGAVAQDGTDWDETHPSIPHGTDALRDAMEYEMSGLAPKPGKRTPLGEETRAGYPPSLRLVEADSPYPSPRQVATPAGVQQTVSHSAEGGLRPTSGGANAIEAVRDPPHVHACGWEWCGSGVGDLSRPSLP